MPTATPIKSSLGPRDVVPLQFSQDEIDLEVFRGLDAIGLDFGPEANLRQLMQGLGMDALISPQLTGTISTPVQFLQSWLPGFVVIATQAMKIDEIVGIMTAGDWADEEVIQGSLELTGKPSVYGDYTNIPLSSWNPNFERRTIVRFEEGLQVGKLEEARASRINVSSAQMKREASVVALNIRRNEVGFYGFNSGLGLTYGFLNDPALPAYVTVAATGTGSTTTWTTKSFLNITADLRTAFAQLRTQSGDRIDPTKDAITLTVPTNRIDYLTVTSDFGNSVMQWLNATYKNVRVVSAPELNLANGGANVFYVHADKVMDNSTDDGKTFKQIVPAKFRLVGVEQNAKNYVEDYSNATAGVLLTRPYAVVRYTGI